jgi:hypothetical protein
MYTIDSSTVSAAAILQLLVLLRCKLINEREPTPACLTLMSSQLLSQELASAALAVTSSSHLTVTDLIPTYNNCSTKHCTNRRYTNR